MNYPQWFELRFKKDSKKIESACEVCGRAMYFPKSKAGKYTTCGGACAEERRVIQRKERERSCLTCKKIFYPRKSQINGGGGKYCCNACAAPTRETGRTPEANVKRALTMERLRARGLINYVRGESHPLWKGGRLAYMARTKPKRNASRRAYLRNNADKAREWARKRRGMIVNRLPRGTVRRIGELQRWRCAACSKDIKDEYHVDHIEPLSKEGEHIPQNLQLLCPGCNLNKSAKDPIEFMQSKGFLL